MSDINPGTTFAPGQIVNADVLNRLVGNATIKDGAIEASHLADDIISARLELNNTTIGDDDCFLVFDASDGELKKIRRGELKVTSNTQYTGGVVTGNTGSETTIDAVTGNITLQSGDVEIASGSLRTASISEGVVGEGIQLLSDLIIPASGRIVSTPIDDGNGNISHDIVLDENGLQIFGTTIDANGLNGGVFDIPTIKTNIIDSNNSSIDITKTITTPAVYAGSEGRVILTNGGVKIHAEGAVPPTISWSHRSGSNDNYSVDGMPSIIPYTDPDTKRGLQFLTDAPEDATLDIEYKFNGAIHIPEIKSDASLIASDTGIVAPTIWQSDTNTSYLSDGGLYMWSNTNPQALRWLYKFAGTTNFSSAGCPIVEPFNPETDAKSGIQFLTTPYSSNPTLYTFNGLIDTSGGVEADGDIDSGGDISATGSITSGGDISATNQLSCGSIDTSNSNATFRVNTSSVPFYFAGTTGGYSFTPGGTSTMLTTQGSHGSYWWLDSNAGVQKSMYMIPQYGNGGFTFLGHDANGVSQFDHSLIVEEDLEVRGKFQIIKDTIGSNQIIQSAIGNSGLDASLAGTKQYWYQSFVGKVPTPAGNGSGGYNSILDRDQIGYYNQLVNYGQHQGTETGSWIYFIGLGNKKCNFYVYGDSYTSDTKAFRIDHPTLEGQDLVHSCIEGPRADLIYRGKVNLVNGTAIASIDESANMTQGTFEAFTRDPQVFVQNDTGWDPVKASVQGGQVTITCQNENSTDSVSWMVVAERWDEAYQGSSNICNEIFQTEQDHVCPDLSACEDCTPLEAEVAVPDEVPTE